MKPPFKTARRASVASGIISAFIFAALFAFIGNIEYLLPPLSIQFEQPSPVTIRLSSSIYLQTDVVKDAYLERWFPVRIGEKIVNKDRYKFISGHVEHKQDVIVLRILGFFVSAFMLALFFSQILRISWPGRRRYLRTEISCYVLLAITLLGTKAFLLFTYFPFTLLPVSSITAIIVFFLGRRLGTLMGIIVSFIVGMMLDVDLIAFVFFICQGLSILLVLRYYRRKKRFLTASMLMTGTGFIIIPAITYMLSQAGDSAIVVSWRNSLIIASVGGGLLCYPVIWMLYAVIRPMLGIVSQSKLNELQELSHPLLKKLQEQAPATWEHSRAIANLAEEAASKVGVDALLVRVGSYFHDIGKAASPEFFVENYSLNGKTGEGPHKTLAPEKSAELIIDHVIEGVTILRTNAIPERIVEFAFMHHGTSVVEFFWRKYSDANKDLPESERLPRSHFTYPGVKPQSREPAIMMLADTVEAASRTISDYTETEIKKVVSYVVMGKLSEGQLDECGLSVENLKTVVKSFADSIHFSHHTRVKYQWQEEKKEEQPRETAQQPQASASSAPPEPATHSKPPPDPAAPGKKAALLPTPSTPPRQPPDPDRNSVATPVPDDSDSNEE
ncbi:MAG: HDIG domain-containing metalloprotein [Pseudomonadota bacterium]